MGAFLAVLALYYICDSTAAHRPMGHAEIAHCTRTYEALKASFLPDRPRSSHGTLAHFEDSLEGYRRFKAWEDANPALVAELRAAAQRQVRTGLIRG